MLRLGVHISWMVCSSTWVLLIGQEMAGTAMEGDREVGTQHKIREGYTGSDTEGERVRVRGRGRGREDRGVPFALSSRRDPARQVPMAGQPARIRRSGRNWFARTCAVE
ncbi:hypothetical protein F4825DRAFT_403722 [Nemania diffusa]|nr:hypothetical protein F4825DRAFT_403722 [Nemania diffusa]